MSDIDNIENMDTSEFLAFRVCGQEYCVNIMSVQEIRGWSPATALPEAPDFIRGVINLRGSVLPIIDLAIRLGLEETDPTTRHVVVILQIRNQIVGLLVDAVSDILTVMRSMIQATPDVMSDNTKSFICGVLAMEGRMISLVDLDLFLPETADLKP